MEALHLSSVRRDESTRYDNQIAFKSNDKSSYSKKTILSRVSVEYYFQFYIRTLGMYLP